MTQWFRRRVARRLSPGQYRGRPALEALEDRTLPSTLTVTNLLDSGDGSLRDQVAAASAGDTVAFDSSLRGTITLTSGELDLTQDITIWGPGATTITVSGGNAQRVFHVEPAARVTISGLTIADGQADFGAGIESEGSLTLTNSTLTDNSADLGGGGLYFVVNDTGSASLTVSGSTFTGNRAADGAGLFSSVTNRSGSVNVTVTSSSFTGNTATGVGGAIDSFDSLSGTAAASFTVTASAFSTNQAASGGAVATTLHTADAAQGTGTLAGVTAQDNTAQNGGGVYSEVVSSGTSQATVTLSGDALESNTASGLGGGLSSSLTSADDGQAALNVTGFATRIDGNTAQSGGGVFSLVFTTGSGSASAAFTPANVFFNAASGAGGGLFSVVNDSGSGTASVSLIGGNVTGNQAVGSVGGGIDSSVGASGVGPASAAFSSLTVTDNVAGSDGGGLYAQVTNTGGGRASAPASTTVTSSILSSNTSGNTPSGGRGGGVFLAVTAQDTGGATVTLSGDTVSDNMASLSAGGGVAATLSSSGPGPASVSVGSTTVSGNTAGNFGGGLYAQLLGTSAGPVTLAVSGSTLSGNSAAASGGGLYATASTAGPSTLPSVGVTLTTSTVSGNRAGTGGGLYFDLEANGAGGAARAAVTASSIFGNSSTGQGGGVYAQEQAAQAAGTATLTLTNSTLYGNRAASGGGLFNTAFGPARAAVGATLLSDTVAFNSSSSAGGGLEAGAGPFALDSSLVAANTAASGADASGAFQSSGYNVVGQADGSSGWGGTDLTGTAASPLDARFGTFGNFGGPTRTLPLLDDSPAVGQGDPAGPPADQRGVVRSRTAPTAGAFELVLPSSFQVTAPFTTFPAGAAFSVTVSALGADGSLLTGYTGTVHFDSSDPAALLPADYTFTPADAGRHTFTGGVTLQTQGDQTLSVTGDGVTGTATFTVTAPLGTWAALTRTAPTLISTMILLTDGTVLAEGLGGSEAFKSWFKLTPDASGSYVNGTWSQLASMGLQRLYFGSNVLPDGRVFLVGGEFTGLGLTNNNTNTGEIYDPVANTWTPIQNFPQAHFGDDPTALLPDGRVLGGYIIGAQTYIYDPASNTWTFAANKLRNDRSDEESWLTLPDGSVLSYDVFHDGHAQRYDPAQNVWVDAGTVPVVLSGRSEELGPAFLLPDGRAFFLGATGHTALYDPASNTWASGPDIPNGLVTDDSPGAMMPNGHVLFAADPPSTGGTTLFEYDPAGNTMTPVLNGPTFPGRAFGVRMLMLPSGQVLVTNGGTQLYIYTPNGTADPSAQPTISAVTDNGDGTFTLTGTQLNGISEGAAYGDDAEMSSNYPLVRLVGADGTVFYARTFNWGVGVATGDAPVSTEFTLPAGIPPGTYSLSVVANGIASAPVDFTVPSAASPDLAGPSNGATGPTADSNLPPPRASAPAPVAGAARAERPADAPIALDLLTRPPDVGPPGATASAAPDAGSAHARAADALFVSGYVRRSFPGARDLYWS